MATDYRLITDGRRYRIQAKKEDGGWGTVEEYSLKWVAVYRLQKYRRAESRRRADATAIWEGVDT